MTELLFKMMLRDIFLDIVKYIPWTQGMCNEVVHIKQRSSAFLPDHFKAQEMWNEAVEADPYTLKCVPVHIRMAEMCKRIVEKYLHPMRDVPYHLKM